MPKVLRSTLTKLNVELELTPVWWPRLTMRLKSGPGHTSARALLAHVTGVALELPLVKSVCIEHNALRVMVTVDRDTTLELLCEAAASCKARIEALDIACLKAD